MTCIQLISPLIQPLSPETEAGDALRRIEQSGVRHLPVVDKDVFLGLVSEGLLLDTDDEAPVSSLLTQLLPCRARVSDLFTTAARQLLSMNSDVVAVVGEKGEYEGAVTLETIFRELALYCGVSSEGCVFVLEMDRMSYSPGEINRIVESNDALLTQLHTHIDPATGLLTVLLTVNREEAADITASFQRHGYTVRHHQGQDAERNELLTNLENLLNYLNV